MKSSKREDVLEEEFQKLGYRSERLSISGTQYIRFVSPEGRVWLYKATNGKLPLPYVGASAILNDKQIAAEYVELKGVRTPRTVRVSNDFRTVADYRANLGLDDSKAIVIKPSDGTLSRGVSANVRTDQELGVALEKARKQSSRVIAQERVEGNEYRFVYVGMQLKVVIVKCKLQVVGDGTSTVRMLIFKENRARLELKGLRVKYPQISFDKLNLARDQFDRIPENGEMVVLGDSIAIEDGASFFDATHEIHETYKDIANRLAADFGGGYLAVDMLIKNPHEPANDQNYAFLEFNDLPAPMYFYACRNNPDIPVMRDLVELIDRSLKVGAQA